jgi:hypothetical protein
MPAFGVGNEIGMFFWLNAGRLSVDTIETTDNDIVSQCHNAGSFDE